MEYSVSAFEAKTHFSELLMRASQGEEILITKRGKPLARLVPAAITHDVKAARAAAKRLESLAEEIKLGAFDWEEWKATRDEDRP
ncbi:MAG: type II toxin-antitoxin system prevent-host-death family antitoxin [Caldilineaceae bacterium]